jgi:hypothetical protein
MPRAVLSLLALLVAFQPGAPAADELQDLYFGEALYQADQGYYFDALERLDAELGQHYGLDEPARDSLYHHIEAAEFSVGDFELNYRMHHRAGRAITAVLEGDVDEAVRNEAAFRLARIHFQKGQMNEALHALGRIEGRVSNRVRDEADFLRANVHLALDQPADAAQVLRPLQSADGLGGFSAYNLGIAYLRDGRSRDALQQLDKAGQVKAGDQATLAIRDKANLVLGTLYMESGSFADAKSALDRVRLQGPLSNQALLSAGWADASSQRFERALVPWALLADRETTDSAVQEAMLALPYAYSQLEVHGRAAILYGRALETFGHELYKLDASIASIRQGKFLEALVREEIHQDKDWVIRLRALPEAPETYYLSELLASHDFQTALQNYLDLEELRSKLATWNGSFDAFEDLIEVRRRYYEPLLPDIDGRFRELDSRIRLRREQHELLSERLQDLLVAPRPELLATTEERLVGRRLEELEAALGAGEEAALRGRIGRLRGLLIWNLRTDYHNRLTRFHKHLGELQQAIDVMEERYAGFVRVRQAATHSYTGYGIPIKRLRTRVGGGLAQVELLMARQGRMLELVAIAELRNRQRRLETYQDQARYALADSYDRATKAQGAVLQ